MIYGKVAAIARQKNTHSSELPMAIRANNQVAAIEKIFTKVWINARHLALIINYFVIGKEKKTANFGTYRSFYSLTFVLIDILNCNDLELRSLYRYLEESWIHTTSILL